MRVIAAAVMAPLGIWVVMSGGLWLSAATGVCAIIAALEWTRMASVDQDINNNWPLALVLSGGAILAVMSGSYSLSWVALIALATGAVGLIIGGLSSKRSLSFGFGGMYVTFPFGAFIYIRDSWENGAVILFWMMILVWTTDIAAFLAGRGFGGPRIAPQKSPNKTWTGALGAFVCTVLAGAALSRFSPSGLIYFSVAAGILSIVAQGGDLLESWFKRRFGVKDASGVIPGHGGVLDRLDSLMAVVSFVVVIKALAPELAPS